MALGESISRGVTEPEASERRRTSRGETFESTYAFCDCSSSWLRQLPAEIDPRVVCDSEVKSTLGVVSATGVKEGCEAVGCGNWNAVGGVVGVCVRLLAD